MGWEDRRTYETRNADGGYRRTWPTTRESIVNEYNRRERCYLGLPYALAEIQRLGLFRALDSSGNETIAARRLLRDIVFVAGVDAAAIASDTLMIEPHARRYDDGDDSPENVVRRESIRLADMARVQAIWEASHVFQRAHEWALAFAYLGTWCWEAIVTPDGPRVVGHDPRAVRVQMDPLGLEIEQAIVTLRYREPVRVEADGGETGADVWHDYKRVLTKTDVRVYIDNELQPDESGPHTLGRVPLTVAEYGPLPGMALGTWAGHGMDDALSVVDSLITQIMTIGTRHANPILLVIGASLGNQADLQAVSRAAEVPNGGSMEWLEASLAGIKTLNDAAISLRSMVRETKPHFVMMESGANASGTAISYRAKAYQDEVEPRRQRFYRALAVATSYADALSRNEPYDPDRHATAIDGGEVLSLDRNAAASLYTGLAEGGWLTREDTTARLKGLGIVPDDADPGDYSAQAFLEGHAALGKQIAELQQLASVMAQIQDGAPALDDAEPEAAAPPDPTSADQPPDGDQGGGALMVGQIQAAISIVQQVSAGALPRESGISALRDLVGLNREQAERLMGKVGRGFQPSALPGSLREIKPSEEE